MTFGDHIAVGIGKVLEILSVVGILFFAIWVLDAFPSETLEFANSPSPSILPALSEMAWVRHFWRICIIPLLSSKNICWLLAFIYCVYSLCFLQDGTRISGEQREFLGGGRTEDWQHKNCFFKVISWQGGDLGNMVCVWTHRAWKLCLKTVPELCVTLETCNWIF